VRDRIVDYLYRIAPDEVSPKTIARVLRMNHSTVTKEMYRILAEKDSPVLSERRGWYRHKLDIDAIAKLGLSKRIELHGIKLEGASLTVNTAYSLAGQAKRQYRKRGTYKEMFEGRVVTITVHEMDLCEVWINTSEVPMSFHQFDRFQSWTKELLDFVDAFSWKITQLGLNVDVREMNLEGLTSLKLNVFRNAWFQIYQRGQDVVRFEAHMFPNLHLEEAMMILSRLVETKVPVRESEYIRDSQEKTDRFDHSYR